MIRDGMFPRQEVDAMRCKLRWSAVGLVCLMGLLTAPVSRGQPAKGKGKAAIIVVRLHEDAAEDGKVTFNGTATTQKGAKRTFSSPPLAPGKQYTYTIVAEWEPNNYTK